MSEKTIQVKPERRHEAGKDQEVHLAEAPDQLGGNEQDGDLARSGDRTQDAHEVLTLAKLDRVAAQERPDEANRGRTDEGEDQDEGDLIAGNSERRPFPWETLGSSAALARIPASGRRHM